MNLWDSINWGKLLVPGVPSSVAEPEEDLRPLNTPSDDDRRPGCEPPRPVLMSTERWEVSRMAWAGLGSYGWKKNAWRRGPMLQMISAAQRLPSRCGILPINSRTFTRPKLQLP